jgi:hypothetical protein
MLKGGNSLGFALQALSQFRVRGEMQRQNLDRDGAVEAGVLGAIHLTHSARTNSGQDFVGAQFRANGKRHCVNGLYRLRSERA